MGVAHTNQMINALKDTGSDHEWYPSTPEILEAVTADMRKHFYLREDEKIYKSVLDIGAGDGRVLKALTEGEKFAIEKARPLLDSLDKSIFIVGTDFHHNTIIDKKVSAIFCNPPYSEFNDWVIKIIMEGNAQVAYLVIPERWEKNQLIQDALTARKATASIIGEFSFLHAERQARGTVNLVKVCFNSNQRWKEGINVDPFDLWFDKNFPVKARNTGGKRSEWQIKEEAERSLKANVSSAAAKGDLVENKGIIYILVQCYNSDMDKLMRMYQKLSEIDGNLLSELDVNLEAVKGALRLKINSLKDAYWKELFTRLGTVTDKLASSSREQLLKKLFASTHVDFDRENAHSIAVWVVKNANEYFDSQIVTLVKQMTEKANVKLYKSNFRTFSEEDWRYCKPIKDLSHYKLDYRIVLERIGGLVVRDSWNSRSTCGLSERSVTFLNDILTIAYNIGFDTSTTERAGALRWDTHVKNEFWFKNHTTGEDVLLFDAKAFKNGNLHIRFRPEFICKLNVEFGRIGGWLKDSVQASEELDIPLEQCQAAFNSNLQLTSSSLLRLMAA